MDRPWWAGKVLHFFGELIGNTDMHAGNLAFFLSDALPLRPAPSYDMLPMLWAPGPQGEIIDRRFAPEPPPPARAESWERAAGMARDFWERVTGDERISQPFHVLARQAADRVQRLHFPA